jgi:hypothetical protein
MTTVHLVIGIAATALFVAAGIVGGWGWRTAGASARFWPLMRAAQGVLVLEIALGGVLLLMGKRPADDLHYVYGLVAIGVSFAAEQFRVSSAETVLDARGMESADDVRELPEEEQRRVVNAIVARELGVMALAALVIVGLLLRALFLSDAA